MIAELTPQVCASLSCTSFQRRSLISSTDQMEQPRISTSLLSPDVSSSPGWNRRRRIRAHITRLRTFRPFLAGDVCTRTLPLLTTLQCLHQRVRVPQHSEVDEGLRDAVVGEHGEPVHVDEVSVPSGLHDAPQISHQDLSSLIERDAPSLKQTGGALFSEGETMKAAGETARPQSAPSLTARERSGNAATLSLSIRWNSYIMFQLELSNCSQITCASCEVFYVFCFRSNEKTFCGIFYKD